METKCSVMKTEISLIVSVVLAFCFANIAIVIKVIVAIIVIHNEPRTSAKTQMEANNLPNGFLSFFLARKCTEGTRRLADMYIGRTSIKRTFVEYGKRVKNRMGEDESGTIIE